MIDKSAEAINSFYSYLRSVLDNPDIIKKEKLESEATNYLNRNPHVKENIDFHSLVGGIKERIYVEETLNFGMTQLIPEKSLDHIEWYDEYLRKNFNNRPMWQRFYNYALSTGLSSVVMKSIDKTTDKILEKCENPKRDDKWSNKGLVVGVVQGGKTTHMIGLCNKAIDAGYRLIVIMPGMLEDLRLQTHERFDAGLIGKDTQSSLDKTISNFTHGVSRYNRKCKVYNFTTANKRGDSVNEVKRLEMLEDGPSILILKKNPTIIKHLIARVYLNENAFKKEPILIIDDESDLASINTKNIPNIKNVSKEDFTSTSLYIRALLSMFNRSAYIGYTATPYANIFQDYREEAEKESKLTIPWKDKQLGKKLEIVSFGLGEGLFPKNFICSLPVFSNYIGFEKLFGDDFFEGEAYLGNRSLEIIKDYVDKESYKLLKRYYDNLKEGVPKKNNPKPDTDIVGWLSPFAEKNWEPIKHFDLPNSLKKAVRFFIIGNIVKRIRKISNKHNSMLISVNKHTITNESIRDQIQEYLMYIRSSYGLGDSDSKIKDDFKDLWQSEFEDNLNNEHIHPPREILWDEIESLLPDEISKVEPLLITGNEDYLDYAPNKSSSIIAIGGQLLSRGITLEGLSVSYFLRKSDNPSADAVTQMGRWFGYRPRYDDICKIYLNQFLLEDFREYYEAEESLRNQFRLMDTKEMLPTDFGLKVPMRNPTASNKARATRLEGFVRNFSGKRKELIFIDTEKKDENTKVVKKLFDSISKKHEEVHQGKVWKNVDSDIILNFLSSYKSPLGLSKTTEERYIEYIKTCNRYGDELKKWNIGFVENDTGSSVSNNLIGFKFIPKGRSYFPKNKKDNKEKIKNWSGKPKDLENYKGEDKDIYRIAGLTEPTHWYLDMGYSKKEADKILINEGGSDEPTLFWKKRRNVPLLTIYPIKSPGDKGNNHIYFSYSIIFPFSNIVRNNPAEFNKEWERINRVLMDQIDRFNQLKVN